MGEQYSISKSSKNIEVFDISDAVFDITDAKLCINRAFRPQILAIDGLTTAGLKRRDTLAEICGQVVVHSNLLAETIGSKASKRLDRAKLTASLPVWARIQRARVT